MKVWKWDEKISREELDNMEYSTLEIVIGTVIVVIGILRMMDIL